MAIFSGELSECRASSHCRPDPLKLHRQNASGAARFVLAGDHAVSSINQSETVVASVTCLLVPPNDLQQQNDKPVAAPVKNCLLSSGPLVADELANAL